MKKLRNPYASLPGYNCFGCSPLNTHGLKMEFYEEGEEIVSTWEPGKNYEGYMNVLHGGIQGTLIDEIASWVVFVRLGTAGVTSKLNIKYEKPVRIDRGKLSLRASLDEVKRNIATIHIKLFDGENRPCTEGVAEYFVFPAEKAKEKMKYPGRDAFYENE